MGQAQQSSSDQPALRLKVEAREVVLPVTVRDKKGALVTTLQKSDFTLAEDGRPQTIKSFTRETNLPFRLGLLVDTSRSLSGAMENERKAAGKFVDQMLPADPKAGTQADQAFLIHFDHEVELLEDFTASREKLHRELDDMGPSRAAQNSSQGPETSDDDRQPGQNRKGRGGTQLYDAVFLAADELMKPKDGRKALVLFSDGVDRGGGRRGGGSSESQVDGKKILEKIATRTGGRYFEAKKKDNLEEIYGQIAEELRGQYLMTYTPDVVDKEGGFHKIALKANKDDLTVVTREGYYAPGGESK